MVCFSVVQILLCALATASLADSVFSPETVGAGQPFQNAFGEFEGINEIHMRTYSMKFGGLADEPQEPGTSTATSQDDDKENEEYDSDAAHCKNEGSTADSPNPNQREPVQPDSADEREGNSGGSSVGGDSSPTARLLKEMERVAGGNYDGLVEGLLELLENSRSSRGDGQNAGRSHAEDGEILYRDDSSTENDGKRRVFQDDLFHASQARKQTSEEKRAAEKEEKEKEDIRGKLGETFSVPNDVKSNGAESGRKSTFSNGQDKEENKKKKPLRESKEADLEAGGGEPAAFRYKQMEVPVQEELKNKNKGKRKAGEKEGKPAPTRELCDTFILLSPPEYMTRRFDFGKCDYVIKEPRVTREYTMDELLEEFDSPIIYDVKPNMERFVEAIPLIVEVFAYIILTYLISFNSKMWCITISILIATITMTYRGYMVYKTFSMTMVGLSDYVDALQYAVGSQLWHVGVVVLLTVNADDTLHNVKAFLGTLAGLSVAIYVVLDSSSGLYVLSGIATMSVLYLFTLIITLRSPQMKISVYDHVFLAMFSLRVIYALLPGMYNIVISYALLPEKSGVLATINFGAIALLGGGDSMFHPKDGIIALVALPTHARAVVLDAFGMNVGTKVLWFVMLMVRGLGFSLSRFIMGYKQFNFFAFQKEDASYMLMVAYAVQTIASPLVEKADAATFVVYISFFWLMMTHAPINFLIALIFYVFFFLLYQETLTQCSVVRVSVHKARQKEKEKVRKEKDKENKDGGDRASSQSEGNGPKVRPHGLGKGKSVDEEKPHLAHSDLRKEHINLVNGNSLVAEAPATGTKGAAFALSSGKLVTCLHLFMEGPEYPENLSDYALIVGGHTYTPLSVEIYNKISYEHKGKNVIDGVVRLTFLEGSFSTAREMQIAGEDDIPVVCLLRFLQRLICSQIERFVEYSFLHGCQLKQGASGAGITGLVENNIMVVGIHIGTVGNKSLALFVLPDTSIDNPIEGIISEGEIVPHGARHPKPAKAATLLVERGRSEQANDLSKSTKEESVPVVKDVFEYKPQTETGTAWQKATERKKANLFAALKTNEQLGTQLIKLFARYEAHQQVLSDQIGSLKKKLAAKKESQAATAREDAPKSDRPRGRGRTKSPKAKKEAGAHDKARKVCRCGDRKYHEYCKYCVLCSKYHKPNQCASRTGVEPAGGGEVARVNKPPPRVEEVGVEPTEGGEAAEDSEPPPKAKEEAPESDVGSPPALIDKDVTNCSA